MRQTAARSALSALVLGLLVCAGVIFASPAGAQTPAMTLYDDKGFGVTSEWTVANQHEIHGTAPVFEWGDTVWAKLEGFDRPDQPTGGNKRWPKILFTLQRLDNGTASNYGFQIDADWDPANSRGRVGLDIGFFCDDQGDKRIANPGNWSLGRLQFAKDPAQKTNVQVDADAGAWHANFTQFDRLLSPGAWQIDVVQGEPYEDANTNGQWDNGEDFDDQNGNGDYDADLHTVAATPVYIANPITVLVGTANPWANDSGPDPAGSVGNGNSNFGHNFGGAFSQRRVLPGTAVTGISFGSVPHGRPSLPYVFSVADRSNLYRLSTAANWPALPPLVRLACRVGCGDMNQTTFKYNSLTASWQQGAAGAPTHMFDVGTPPTALLYDLVEYPPIFKNSLVFQRVGGNEDPTQTEIPLPLRSGATTLSPVAVQAWVRVPQYQPDTIYGTGWPEPAPAAAPGVPASDPIRVWVDCHPPGDQVGDGSLQRIREAATGDMVCDTQYYTTATERPAAYEAVAPDNYAEPYREFNLTVDVPTDFRFRVEEPTLDLGKQPHNSAAGNGQPHPWSVRPLTVTNLGNVTLLNLRVAPDTVNLPASDYRSSGALYTPDSDFDWKATSTTRGLGVSIPWADTTVDPAIGLRRYFWWSFGGEATADPTAWEVSPGGSFVGGQLRKARPGASSPTSIEGSVAPGPDWTASGYVGPRIGVVTPFGQPVGDYANQFVMYEENNGAAGLQYTPLLPANSDWPVVAPFKVKIAITDRQLTEEYSAYSIDRPAYGQQNDAGVIVAADSFDKWWFADTAYSDGNRKIMSSDTQPAAARFSEPPTSTSHRRLSLYWTSNRRDVQPDGSLRTPGPPAGASPAERPQSWYLYSSRSYELMDNAAYYWPFWGREPAFNPLATSPTNPPEMKVPGTSLFGASLPNGGKLISEQYTAPYLAQTISTTGATIEPYYLFFQATGHGRGFTSDAAGAPARDTYRASQIYYTKLGAGMEVDPDPTKQICVPVGMAQPEVVKHTPRALSYHTVGMQGVPADTHLLWAFWHGGAENAWKGYYNLNVAADKTNAADWRLGDGSGPGVLPLGGDFTTVQDLVPVLYRGPSVDMRTGVPSATTRELIDLYFTAFSKYRRNCDVYTARLDPSVLRYGTRGAWRAKLPFARVERENLSNDNNRNFASQHLEWLTWPYAYATPTRAVFPRIYRYAADGTLLWASPDPTVGGLVNPNTGWTFNQDRYCWTIRYTDAWAQDASGNATDLRGRECTVTVYPMAGVVTFSLPVNEGDRVAADYTPTIMRVAASPQMEASPVAFLDTRYGPAQSAVDGTRTYLYPDGRPISRDRLWLFWTRVAPQVTKPSVWHKTMRLMVQLPYPIRRGQAVSVQDEFGTDITHFTIDTGTAVVDPADPTQDTVLYPGRLYFPTYQSAAAGTARALEGRRVTVTYTNHYTGGAGAQPVDRYIRWRDERPEAPLPIDDVANEGRLCAIPDLAPDLATVGIAEYLRDPGTWRVWLFWTSSRPKATVFNASTGQPVQFSNDTDLRYMTLAPRLDFRSTLP